MPAIQMLDSPWANFGCMKFFSTIPSALAFGLVSYISWGFLW